MPDPKNAPAGSEPPPTVTYKNPRRTSPENSITLRHHRLAREASKRHSPAAIPAVPGSSAVMSPRRNSSGESNETGLSDPKHWFNKLNNNANGDMDTTAMDVDPPFYQRETDSSNEEVAKYGVPSQSPAYRFVQGRTPGMRPGLAHSSSADDYRSVIDDLTVENKRLKEELKKYKQMGPDSLREDKLFEVKVHGLSSRRRRELEAALRDFTTSLDGSSTGASPNRTKMSGKSKVSKHASSSSGSNSRPVDSAYASMSTGPGSSSTPGQVKAARQRSNQNIENYLRDIPEGLWPRASVMTEKDKKKLVVKRLEHLFTGKMGDPAERVPLPQVPEPIVEDVEMEGVDGKVVRLSDTSREAQIRPRLLPQESISRESASHSHSHSNSHSMGEQPDSRDTGNGSGSGSRHAGDSGGSGSGSGNNSSPQTAVPPTEQRPTRPGDLDPDRRQVPSENMDYIRHLGLVAPESKRRFSAKDVSPDAEGWVYLNLLCNLAQLHILNVTPAFIRNAVSEKSTKFQLSPDGRKIRWRGGVEGTRFNNDSGSNSQRIQSSDDTDGSNEQNQRKKQKTQTPGNGNGNDVTTQPSKFGLGVHDSNSSESFHYKPLFVHHQTCSSDEQPSGGDETGSSYGPPEESNLGMNSRWGQSGVSGVSQRKRRRDGAIIYYSGAPFCTDLSGDFSEGNGNEEGTSTSPATYDMTSSGRPPLTTQGPVSLGVDRPQFSRSTSGSSLPYRPLSSSAYTLDKLVKHDKRGSSMDLDDDPDLPELTTSGDTIDDIDADFAWSKSTQQAPLLNLEASGLGGVYPDDHFVMVVSTRRPKDAFDEERSIASGEIDETHTARRKSDPKITTDSIIRKLATLTTGSPLPVYMASPESYNVQIEYVAGKFRRLPPVPLPPPAFYFPASDSDFDDDDGESDTSSESLISRQAIVEDGPSSDVDLSGNDEEDEHEDDAHAYNASGSISPDIPIASEMKHGEDVETPDLLQNTTGSSVATAGGEVSGYNSSIEQDV